MDTPILQTQRLLFREVKTVHRGAGLLDCKAIQMSKRLTQLAQHGRKQWNFLSWEKQKNSARLALHS